MGILLTKELKDAKETIQDNPYIEEGLMTIYTSMSC